MSITQIRLHNCPIPGNPSSDEENTSGFSDSKAQRERFVECSILHSSFTGKEKDSESGFHYFGARYYDSEALTGWLSVDPMADKYTSMSPYIYCAGNPVKLVDPDGENPVGGAILGAVVNGISAAVEGKSGSEIFAATVGGAVAGACEGSVFFAAVGSAAGEFVEEGINNLFEGKSLMESVKDVDLEKIGVAAAGGAGGKKLQAVAKTSAMKSTAKKVYTKPVQQKMHKQVVKEARQAGHPTTGKNAKQQMNKTVRSRSKNTVASAGEKAEKTVQVVTQASSRQLTNTHNKKK